MLKKLRNSFQYEGSIFEPVSRKIDPKFDCGDSELNDFFHVEQFGHDTELLAKTYSFTMMGAEGETLLALISFCNDAVKFTSISDRVKMSFGHRYVPAVKIACIGVRKERCGNGVGTTLLTLSKILFTAGNRTGCRIITVDAYNNPRVLRFYQKNYFDFLNPKDYRNKTRIMWYDLCSTKETALSHIASQITPL